MEYADPTERMYRQFKAFDANGDLISFTWNSLAAADGESSMIWARFDEPIEPENVCKLTFNGETIFER